MGRASKMHQAAVESATPVTTFQATDQDLPEILQPEIAPQNGAPKAAPQRAELATAPKPEIQKVAIDSKIIETFLKSGDLAQLTTEQRVSYYNATCESLGLNPLTRPFDFIGLNGKIVMYAKRDCTDQLRRIYSVSITSLETKKEDGIYIVTAHAKDGKGRIDAATGAVAVENVRGNDLANVIMKAETKAKRRVTLSLCGLGILDESEIEAERVVDVVISAPARNIAEPVPASQDAPKAAPQQAPPSTQPAQQASTPEATAKAASPQQAASPASGNGSGKSASKDAYQPLPEAASGRDKVTKMEEYCFGASPCDNRVIRLLPMAVGVPKLLTGPYVVEQNGKLNPKMWNPAMASIEDRSARFDFIQQQLSTVGREGFVVWAEATVAAARGRGVFGK